MNKIEATVTVEYIFEFEIDSESRTEVQQKAEELWDKISSCGLESEKYHDTEIDWNLIN